MSKSLTEAIEYAQRYCRYELQVTGMAIVATGPNAWGIAEGEGEHRTLAGWSFESFPQIAELAAAYLHGYSAGVWQGRQAGPFVGPGLSLVRAEFGVDFHPDIQSLIGAGEAYDQSWHNDVAPSVSDDCGDGPIRVRLWDHGEGPHDEGDESGGVRFAVTTYDAEGDYEGDTYAGDDIDAAIAAFRAAKERR